MDKTGMGVNIVNDPQMLPVGATLQGGKYKVVAQLAHGGFGKTYKVWDSDLDEYMALKELFISGINERRSEQTSISLVATADMTRSEQNKELFETQQRKFRSEARRLFKLLHPNIVRVHTCFDENNTSYYVMDYIDGESLSARLNRLQRPLTEDELMPLLPEILDALDYIHSKSIWHLDLKPANIMIDAEGHAHLIDFGASKQLAATDERTSTLSNMALTRGYAPPEQEAQDVEDLGPWTDFYALGATLYKLLTNEEKLPSSSKLQNGYELTFPDSVSPRTRDLVRWMMNPSRLKRPRNVAEIRNFLNGKVQDEGKDNADATIIVDANNANDTKADKDETVVIDTPKSKPETKPEVKPEQAKLAAVEQEPEPPKKTSTKIGKYIIGALVVLGLCIGGWRISSSVIESSAESEAAAIDTFLNGYEVLVQKAEAARTVEEQEALMPEWEAMGRELSNLTGRLNDEQQQRLDELNTRLEKAELIVPVEVR